MGVATALTQYLANRGDNLSTDVALNVGAELGKILGAPALFVMISKVRPDRCLIIQSLLERFRFSWSM